MNVNLVTLQVKTSLEDYLSYEAFAAHVEQLMSSAMDNIDASYPTLVVFPEYLGMCLTFIPHYAMLAKQSGSFKAFLSNLPGQTRAARQHALFVEHALEAQTFYDGLFAELAKNYGVYIIAGSICLPDTDNSPHQDGRFIVNGTKVFNTSPFFNPQGRCIGRTSKIRLPEGEDQLFDSVRLEQLTPVQTSMGKVGTLLCFDGYHHAPIEQLDKLGASIVAQPIHFPSPHIRFDGSGAFVPAYEDFAKLLQGRENIRFGICSALVGEIFPDRRAEGLSHIVVNHQLPAESWKQSILMQVEDPFAEAAISAVVDLS